MKSVLALATGAFGLASLKSGGEDSIPGSYIVVLKDTVSVQGVTNFAKSHGAYYTYPALNGFAVELTASQLERIRTSDVVDYVQENMVTYTYYETQRNPTWGIDRVDQVDLPLDGEYKYFENAGEGVNAYVVDTGIWMTHEEFANEDGTSRATSGYNFVQNREDAMDDNGHGTHCAGTIGGNVNGLAKFANLIGIKVMGRFGLGGLDNMLGGFQFLIDSHKEGDKSVVNFSLGAQKTPCIDALTTKAVEAGIVVVAASGNNNGDACKLSPANLGGANSDVITVNAFNVEGERASFSNWGECTDIFAPGEQITSAWKGGDDKYVTIDGTSMACPHVVGAAAIILSQNDRMTPAQVKDTILNMASEDQVTDIKGSPNLALYSAFR